MNNKFYDVSPVKIANLLLDEYNFRYDVESLNSQQDCINSIVLDNKAKIINLIQDILERGLLPDPIIVWKQDDFYIVKEGNRRVCAIKLLNNPELCKNDAIKRKIYKAIETSSSKLPKEIYNVKTSDDFDEVMHYVRLKHTGENDGIGTINWGASEKDRFRTSLELPRDNQLSWEVLDEVNVHGLNINTKKFAITTLQRVLSDPAIREKIGIDVIKGHLQYTHEKSQVISILKEVVSQIANKTVVVGDVYGKEERCSWLEKVKSELNLPTFLNPLPNPEFFSSKKSHEPTKSKPKSKKHPVKKSSQRKKETLIQESSEIKIPEGQIKACAIFQEMKELNIRIFPIAVSVLFRSLLELSTIYFLNNCKLKKKFEESSLKKNYSEAVKQMMQKEIINKKEFNRMIRFADKPTDIVSIAALQAIVHSKDAIPIIDELKSYWTGIETYIYHCWHAKQDTKI